MEIKDLCRECIQPDLSNDHKKSMVSVGNSVTEVVSVNKGHRQESAQRYKCSICGAVWERLTEGGVGGTGDFWNLFDPPHTKKGPVWAVLSVSADSHIFKPGEQVIIVTFIRGNLQATTVEIQSFLDGDRNGETAYTAKVLDGHVLTVNAITKFSGENAVKPLR
ncbi:MAG TPA: hypothetical protein VLV31_05610 [Candidatus Acidoferrales bacterium]|nr:hypothetical protein [Candidatus Acidoferrales bacterium]